MSKKPSIQVKNLNKSFKDLVAVDDLSFDVYPGEVLALLGSNGAGKTTTLKMIAGFLSPDSGEVLLDGKNHIDNEIEIKKKLGFVTNNIQLYQQLSIKESLEYLGGLHLIDKETLDERLEMLAEIYGLNEFFNKKYSELSAGQKQRSVICSALINDPDIIVFDEVTASLDILVSTEIMDSLIREKERGKAILFSTHILSEVEYISDRIVIIEKGRKVDELTSQDLKDRHGGQNIMSAFRETLLQHKKAA